MPIRILLSKPVTVRGPLGMCQHPKAAEYCEGPCTHIYPCKADGSAALPYVLTRGYSEDWSACDRDSEIVTLLELPGEPSDVFELKKWLGGTTWGDLTVQQKAHFAARIREFGLTAEVGNAITLFELIAGIQRAMLEEDHGQRV